MLGFAELRLMARGATAAFEAGGLLGLAVGLAEGWVGVLLVALDFAAGLDFAVAWDLVDAARVDAARLAAASLASLAPASLAT